MRKDNLDLIEKFNWVVPLTNKHLKGFIRHAQITPLGYGNELMVWIQLNNGRKVGMALIKQRQSGGEWGNDDDGNSYMIKSPTRTWSEEISKKQYLKFLNELKNVGGKYVKSK